jgi:hypothetical protein
MLGAGWERNRMWGYGQGCKDLRYLGTDAEDSADEDIADSSASKSGGAEAGEYGGKIELG